jgi:hypothetical protein
LEEKKEDLYVDKEVWRTIFKLPTIDVEIVSAFLLNKLKPPHTFEMHENAIIINSPDKNSAYRCGEWVRHRALERLLDYSVGGFKGKKIIYLSYCKKCRAGESHLNHKLGERIEAEKEEAGETGVT